MAAGLKIVNRLQEIVGNRLDKMAVKLEGWELYLVCVLVVEAFDNDTELNAGIQEYIKQ